MQKSAAVFVAVTVFDSLRASLADPKPGSHRAFAGRWEAIGKHPHRPISPRDGRKEPAKCRGENAGADGHVEGKGDPQGNKNMNKRFAKPWKRILILKSFWSQLKVLAVYFIEKKLDAIAPTSCPAMVKLGGPCP